MMTTLGPYLSTNHQPGLDDDEQREGKLDRGATPVILGVDGIDEQRPSVLQVGDHRHADDAHHELDPAEAAGWVGRGGEVWLSHRVSSDARFFPCGVVSLRLWRIAAGVAWSETGILYSTMQGGLGRLLREGDHALASSASPTQNAPSRG
jgi:hypothetical protein